MSELEIEAGVRRGDQGNGLEKGYAKRGRVFKFIIIGF